MILICDECHESFDVFTEGYSSQYVQACGKCWAVEVAHRQEADNGGRKVFTR